MLHELKLPASLIAITGILPEIVLAADGSMPPARAQEISLLPLKIAFVLSLAISIYGLYASRKKKIVVFANLTDVMATLAIPLISALAFFLAVFLEMKGIFSTGFILACALGSAGGVAKATYAYNHSINSGLLGVALALFTKFFLVSLYVFLVLLIFFNGSKRKGESENAFRRRVRHENSAYFLGATTIFGILAYLGLWDRNFVTIKEYIAGEWGADVAA